MEKKRHSLIYYLTAFAVCVGLIIAGIIPYYGLDVNLASSAMIELGLVGIVFLVIFLIYQKLLSKFDIGENSLLFLGLVSLLLNIYMVQDYVLRATTMRNGGYIILSASGAITISLLLIVSRNIIINSRK
jgi:ABC-type microcin C transport system permease subunit YejE